MIKSELTQRILAQNPHLFLRDAEKVINAVLEEVVAALKRRDRVEVRGFGVFFVKQRSVTRPAALSLGTLLLLVPPMIGVVGQDQGSND
jgi:nucleoid DNA-binding protein